jgi:aminoglycoside 6'-N-acetyltransferase I
MIVQVTPENIKDCIPVFLQSYNQPPWNYHWTFEQAEQYLTEYTGCQQFVGFILYDQDQPVGALLGHAKTWWTGQQLMIDEIFISGQKQKMGYGKRLLAFCEEYAAEMNINTVILMTNKYMPAYSFYNKANYTTTEQFVFMFKQPKGK